MASLSSFFPVAALFPPATPHLVLPEFELREDLGEGRDAYVQAVRVTSFGYKVADLLSVDAVKRAFDSYHGWVWDGCHEHLSQAHTYGAVLKLVRSIAHIGVTFRHCRIVFSLLPDSVRRVVEAATLVTLAVAPVMELISSRLYFHALATDGQEGAEERARWWSKAARDVDRALCAANLLQIALRTMLSKPPEWTRNNLYLKVANSVVLVFAGMATSVLNLASTARLEKFFVYMCRIPVLEEENEGVRRRLEEMDGELAETRAAAERSQRRLHELARRAEDLASREVAEHLMTARLIRAEEGLNFLGPVRPINYLGVERIFPSEPILHNPFPPSATLQSTTVRVNLKELRGNPLAFLTQITDRAGGSFVSMGVSLIDREGEVSPAVDAGGPTRQVLEELFGALQQHGFLRLRDGQFILGRGDPTAFRGLGVVLADLLAQTDIAISPHFSPSFFEALSVAQEMGLTPDQVTDEFALVIAHHLFPQSEVAHHLLDLLAHSEWSPQEREWATVYLAGESGDPKEEIRRVAREFVDESGIYSLIAVAQGMKERLGRRWEDEFAVWPTWRVRLVGVDLEHGLPVSGQQQVADWINEWWGKAPEPLRKRFLVSLTGSEWLPADTKIIALWAYDTPVTGYPYIHSCGRQIDVPIYDSYDDFREKLEVALASIQAELDEGEPGFHGP